MPRKKLYNAKKKVAYRRKRTSRRYKKKAIPLAGLRQTELVKFRFVTNVVLDAPSTGMVATQQYRAASIYDPDYSGVGTSVQNYSEYEANYAHYMVLGSKITIKQLATLSTATTPGMWGITLARNLNSISPASTSALDILRSSGSYGGNIGYKVAGGHSPNSVTVNRRTFSARKFYQIPKKDSVFTYETLHALFGQNPTEEPTYTLWFGNCVSGGDPNAQVFQVTIDYITKVWEPRYQTDI